jgi:release factor glutamine methyltransferase
MDEKEALFTRVLGCGRTQLYLERERKLEPAALSAIAGALRRRAAGEPLEYILGTAEFMGREFAVNRDVLIPRPETELLAEAVIAYCRKKDAQEISILEIGAGSGAVCVSLAAALPQARITATDISEAALSVAGENARRYGCACRIELVRADIFPLPGHSFDIIVSNPPYVRSGDIEALEPEVRWQPYAALDGGDDGLVFYRRIIGSAGGYLRRPGRIFFEVGFDQCAEVKEMIISSKKFAVKEVIRDYNTIQRIIIAGY